MVWSPFGRFAVGFTDAEWDRQDGQPVAGRLFYPAPSSLKAAAAGTPGVPWLWDRPYAEGLGKFLFFRLRGRVYDFLQQCLVSLVWATRGSQRMDLTPGAPLAPDAPDQLPLVIFTHGLGGNRFQYSIICSELASQGYVVFALEHFDGSASAARLPGGRWLMYGGLGDEKAQAAKTRVRVEEMKTGLQLMHALHKGDKVPGLTLSSGLDAASFLKGRIDMRCVAAAGHSYGGATTTALVAEDARFHCGVALDPWWYAVPPESKALTEFETRTPLLIVGSHDWNVPNVAGQLFCGGERQQRILEAVRAQQDGHGLASGGAMLLSIAGSSHNSFADALPLFGLGWLLDRLGLAARLDPVLGIHLCCTAVLHFLSLHLPLTTAQRAAQNWEPGKGHSALDKIRERDAAGARGSTPPRGPLSWLFPGRGLLLGLSDMLLDILLLKPQVSKGPSPAGAAPAGSGAQQMTPAGPSERPQPPEPSDVVTGLEAAEAALPSADPASGPHPHAPSAPRAVGAQAAAHGLVMSPERRSALRAGLNTRHSGVVEAGEVEEMHALLGSEHIFKCLTV